MSYYNCGASQDDVRIPTKKALKEAMATAPEEVLFDGTASAFQSVEGYRGNELDPDVKLTVCGPDPYYRRNWWATVELVGGKVKVS